jgi:hypothetical protein
VAAPRFADKEEARRPIHHHPHVADQLPSPRLQRYLDTNRCPPVNRAGFSVARTCDGQPRTPTAPPTISVFPGFLSCLPDTRTHAINGSEQQELLGPRLQRPAATSELAAVRARTEGQRILTGGPGLVS